MLFPTDEVFNRNHEFKKSSADPIQTYYIKETIYCGILCRTGYLLDPLKEAGD
jgi:hypothetical protein